MKEIFSRRKDLRFLASGAAVLGLSISGGLSGFGDSESEARDPQILLPPNQVIGNISISELDEQKSLLFNTFDYSTGEILGGFPEEKPDWLIKAVEVDKQICLTWPVYGPLSTYFGEPRGRVFHPGIDIDQFGQYGEPVAAAAGGKVEISDWDDWGLGYHLVIKHPNGMTTVYGHMSELWVIEEQDVKAGEAIGAVGSTGYSTGPHMHFEVRYKGQPVDPLRFLLDKRNGCSWEDGRGSLP